ncbi:g3104 [Coccomyxa elongata]
MHIPVQVGERTVHATLDGGAQFSVITQMLVFELGLEGLVEEAFGTYTTASGQVERPAGKIKGLEIAINNYKYNLDLIVTKAITYDMLLGMDFQKSNRDPGFCLDRFLVAASRWVLPKRLPSGRSGRGVRPTAVCVGASTAGGDTGLPFTREGLVGYSRLAGYCSAAWLVSFRLDRCVPMAPARLHAGIHRRRAAGLNADDDATP